MNNRNLGRVFAAWAMAPGMVRISTATAPMASRGVAAGFHNSTARSAPTTRRAIDEDKRPDPDDEDDELITRPRDDEDEDQQPADDDTQPVDGDDDLTEHDEDDDREDEKRKR